MFFCRVSLVSNTIPPTILWPEKNIRRGLNRNYKRATNPRPRDRTPCRARDGPKRRACRSTRSPSRCLFLHKNSAKLIISWVDKATVDIQQSLHWRPLVDAEAFAGEPLRHQTRV